MARNNNEWFKFFFRNWIESERVRRMPLAAQALYVRALCLQAIHGSLPCDLEELAMLLHVRFSEMDAWNHVTPHFIVDATGTEPRLYNEHLREVLVLRERDAEARRKGAESANAQRNAQRTQKTKQSAKRQRAVRASSSLSSSYSLSLSFSKLWEIYPNGKGKSVALRAWENLNPDEKLADTILAHVAKRATTDPQWIKDGGQYVPMCSTFLNQRRWEDEYQTGFTTPPRGIQKPTFDNNTAEYADLIPWEDAPVGN